MRCDYCKNIIWFWQNYKTNLGEYFNVHEYCFDDYIYQKEKRELELNELSKRKARRKRLKI